MCRLSSVTSAAPVIAVGSVSRSFAGYGSPATATVAALTAAGNAAPPTATVSVKLALSPAASGPAYAAVAACPRPRTPEPAPVPPVKPRPAGSVSVTVIAAGVVTLPVFVTTIVYAPLCDTANGEVCRLSMATSTMPVTAVGSVSTSSNGSASPAIATDAEFVTPG